MASIRRFDQNAGQWPEEVRFVARTPHGMLVLGRADARLNVRGTDGRSAAIGLRWDAAARAIDGVQRLGGVSHYLIGSDRARWRSSVPGFERVRYAEVAPHVDLEFYGAADGFEYDLVVRPGGDLDAVSLRFDGVSAARVGADGSVVLDTSAGTFRQHAPIAFQERNGVRTAVDVRYELHDGRIGFRAGAYDRSQTLVIDPTFDFSTYLGGSGLDEAAAVATDAAGNIYVTGSTLSADFPTAPPSAPVGGGDAFVVKLAPNGSSLVWATYLGGTAMDTARGIAVSASGSAYVAGTTASSDFPTVNPAQTWNGGGDAFVARLADDGGSLIFSTYLGGSASDDAHGIAVDGTGAAYVTGPTFSVNFPLLNAFRTTPGGSFVTKLSPAGAVVYSTFFGDAPTSDFRVTLHAIAADPAGAAYVGGETRGAGINATSGAYLMSAGAANCALGFRPIPSFLPCLDGVAAKLTPSGSLAYSTFIHANPESAVGGLPNEVVSGITVDAAGRAYLVGTTTTTNFTTTPGAAACACAKGRVFVMALNPTGSGLVYSATLAGAFESGIGTDFTTLGTSQIGSGGPAPAIAVDALGQAIVAGWTRPSASNPSDVFVAALSTTGALVYQNSLAGSQDDKPTGLAKTPDAAVVVVGSTSSTDFPNTKALQPLNGGGGDAFVTKLRNPQIVFAVETPANQATVYTPFTITGWALDRGSAVDAGIDGVHIWAFSSTGAATFIAAPTPNLPRPDIAAIHGPQFANAGYQATVTGLSPGTYAFAITPHSSVTNTFAQSAVLTVTIADGRYLFIDHPTPGGTTYGGATLDGWAIDHGATAGTGIAAIHIYAYPNPGSGQPPIFLGLGNYGTPRPDVAAIFGSQFANSGFTLTLPPLTPGPYLFVAAAFSSVTGSFLPPKTVLAQAAPSQPAGSLDLPSNNSVVGSTFVVGGWAIDRTAPTGTGIDYVHVYAFKNGTPTFLGAATLGVSRPDIGAIFGSQFTNAGYSFTVTGLAAGTYDLYTFAHSTVTGENIVRANRITVQ